MQYKGQSTTAPFSYSGYISIGKGAPRLFRIIAEFNKGDFP